MLYVNKTCGFAAGAKNEPIRDHPAHRGRRHRSNQSARPLALATLMSGIYGTQRWRKLAAQTIKQEPVCALGLPGCTIVSTQADHITPVSIAPHLALLRSNTQGVCQSCNRKRGNNPIDMCKPATSKPALTFFK